VKIAMLIWNYWPGPEGGAERQCRKLSHALARRGHSVLVITHGPGRNLPRRQPDGGTTLLRRGRAAPLVRTLRRWRDRLRPDRPGGGPGEDPIRPPPRRFRLLAPFQWLDHRLFMAEAARALRNERPRPDVLHVHESHWLAGWTAWQGHRLGLPVICKETDFPTLSALGQDVPASARWDGWRRRADYLAMNQAIREDLQQKGIPGSRIHDLPNGVDIPPVPVDSAREGPVLFVGNFTQGAHRKAFDVLLEAWGRVILRRPEARLKLAGAGDTRRWMDKAQAERCAHTVEFLGFVADVSALYRDAAIFVLPSRREGLSNALLEAQSVGLPAVVSDLPGNRAVIEHEVNGLVVPVDHPEALAQALLRLLGDPALRARLGAAGRSRAVSEFALDRVVDRLLAIYPQAVVPAA
jgi:glycosyltransferase involved in cell wall biosynthesis